MDYLDDEEEVEDVKTYLANQKKKEDKKKSIGNKQDDFEPLQELGSGRFGTAFKVKSKINNETYAMKIVNLGDLDNPNAIRLSINEAKFLRLLSHPNIIKYYSSFQEGDYLYIIEEFADNGDMTNLLKKHKESGKFIKERKLWNIFLQCMEGLAYIHKVGAIHRDIKTENIFFDKNMNVKIGDFGTSALMEKDKNNNKKTKYLNSTYLYFFENEEMICHGTQIISKEYESPEMSEETGYDQKN